MSHLKEIENWVLDACETAYHPSCSAKMGTENDPMAVVDSSCRVFGTQNLRVVDSSIMPSGSLFQEISIIKPSPFATEIIFIFIQLHPETWMRRRSQLQRRHPILLEDENHFTCQILQFIKLIWLLKDKRSTDILTFDRFENHLCTVQVVGYNFIFGFDGEAI